MAGSGDIATPWSWIPQSWLDQAAGAAPVPPEPAPMQPGLGIPQEALAPIAPLPPAPEPAMYAPPPVEEPAQLQPGLGVPQAAVDASVPPAEIEMPPEYVGQGTPEVDAISGVDAEPPPVPEAPAEPTEQTPSGFFDPMDASSWAHPLSSADLFEMGVNDPVGYALHQQAMAEGAAANARRAQAPIEAENSRRREQEVKDLMETTAKANAVRDRVLNTKIDAGRWWASRSVPQKVASYIAVIIGGLMQGRRGGPNQALQAIDSEIDRDIAEQTANIDKDRSMVAQLRADGLSDFQAKQAIRAAWYNAALSDLETRRQDFEPAGTTQARMAQAALEIRGRLQVAANAAHKDAFDQELKTRKDARETAELASKLRRADLDYAVQAKKLGGGVGGGGIVKPGNLSAEEVNAMLPPGTPQVAPKQGGYTPVEAKQHVELASTVTAENRKTTALQVEGIVNANNQPFAFASPPEAQAFRKKVAAVEQLNKMIGELAADINEKGGTVGFVNSGLNKKYESKLATIDLILKDAFETGSLDEGTDKKMKSLKGGNVTSMITGGTEGLDTLRDDLVDNLNIDIRRQPGYDGPGFNPAYKPRLPRAATTSDDEDYKNVLKSSYLPAADMGKAKKLAPQLADAVDVKQSAEYVDADISRWEREAREGSQPALDKLHGIAKAKNVNAAIRKLAEGAITRVKAPKRER